MHVLKKSTETAKQKKVINLLVGEKGIIVVEREGERERERERETQCQSFVLIFACQCGVLFDYTCTTLSNNIFLLSKTSWYCFYFYQVLEANKI